MTAATGGTVKVPGFGAQPKRTVIIVGAGVVLVAGVAYWRYKQTAGTSSTGVGNAVDNTPTSTRQAPIRNVHGGTHTRHVDNPPVKHDHYANNAEWEHAAQDRLVHRNGQAPGKVAQALADYLTAQDVVKGSEVDDLIHQAIAATGHPPIAGEKGYPPNIHHVPGHKPPPKDKHTTLHITVHGGETLGLLAERYYGSRGDWHRIVRANPRKLRHETGESDLKNGLKLTIPNATHNLPHGG